MSIRVARGLTVAADDGSQEFAISPADVVRGPTEWVTGGRTGANPAAFGGSWVSVRIRGAWHPIQGDPRSVEVVSPAVYDSNGDRLQLGSIGVGPGVTEVAAVVRGPLKALGPITFVLRAPTTTLSDHAAVELKVRPGGLPARSSPAVALIGGQSARIYNREPEPVA